MTKIFSLKIIIFKLGLLDLNSLVLQQFLTKVVAISYTGDIRRNIGAEDPRKVEKIVAGAASQLRAIYLPILTL